MKLLAYLVLLIQPYLEMMVDHVQEVLLITFTGEIIEKNIFRLQKAIFFAEIVLFTVIPA